MARDTWAYREVVVESVANPRTGALRIRPLAGQAYAPTLNVQCSRALSDPAQYPAGTRFLLLAKLTDRQGGAPFLYAYYGDPVTVLTRAQANKFVSQYRRLRL